MSWQSDMVLIVRAIINDMDIPYTYSDSKLEQLIVTSAQLLKREVDFEYTYTIDIEAVSISPDPLSSSDDGFINIVSLKTACLVLGGEVKVAAANNFKVTDGGATIDSSVGYYAKKGLYDQLCEDLANAKIAYVMGNVNTIKAILTPYTVNYGNTGFTFG